MANSVFRQNPDPIEVMLSSLTLASLQYLAMEFHISTRGRKEELIRRLLTALIPLEMMLETLRRKELLLVCKKLAISPLPRSRQSLIETVYRHIIDRFDNQALIRSVSPKYKFIRPLGQGGQGGVFLARESFTQRTVALKYALLPEGATPLFRELRILASLDHPNTERLYTFEIVGKHPPSLFLVVEYCGSLTLENALFHDRVFLSPDIRLSIIRQILSGLSYYHSQNIVHGDISTTNIFLVPFDNSWKVKFIDFGASRIGFEPIITPIQNDRYSAPEISEFPPTVLSDVFSTAAVIAEILSQKLLFTKKEQKSDVKYIERWLQRYIKDSQWRNHLEKGLSCDPGRRFTDGVSMRNEWLALVTRLQGAGES